MWWNTMSVLQQVMFVIACSLTAVLFIQVVMMFVGGASDLDGSADGGLSDAGDVSDIGGDVGDIGDVGDVGDIGDVSDMGDGDIGGGVSDGGLHGGGAAVFGMKLLSLRSLLAFAVIGSWLCYTLCYSLEWYYAVLISIGGGFIAACGMAAALVGMEKLQDNGNLDPNNAVGKVGTVYLTIPAKRNGRGKINILIQERYAEYEAVTDSDEPIPTGASIQVIRHDGGNVLLVKKHQRPSITIVNE
ncbi:MAG: hypothetical protein J1G38_05625 [Clostridiales bacterium]|nr:hypothetical protein [Clostridiales bacterium]